MCRLSPYFTPSLPSRCSPSGSSPFTITDDQNTAPRCAECEGGAGLKTCTACKEVKYCSVGCQRQRRHWPRHKKECKRRAADLLDESLLKQPPRKEECPICYLPIPFAYSDMSTFLPCFGKIICDGCCHSF
jgi:hypothetical protein